jgi:hypothetical protein
VTGVVVGGGRRRILTVSKAETVRYYWAQSGGRNSPPATLTFTRPGTLAAESLTIAPPGSSSSGEAVLVVTSPVAVASAPATYALRCTSPKMAPTASPVTSHAPSATASVSTASRRLVIDDRAAPLNTTLGQAYSGTVTVSGGRGPYVWGTATGLPRGLKTTGNNATLTITGAPTTEGTFAASVPVSDSSSPRLTATAHIYINVNTPNLLPVSATVHAPTTAYLGVPYSGSVTATGGDGTFTWTVTGLDAGMTATPHGATLTFGGTPEANGEWLVTGRATDGETYPQWAGWVLHITVIPPPITITANATSVATVGQPYSGTFTATGGNGTPLTWSVTGEPQGLTPTASGATLTISGTPTASDVPAVTPPESGNFDVHITVSDSLTSYGRTFEIVVSAPP